MIMSSVISKDTPAPRRSLSRPEPGPRLHYGEGYYAAYLRDPDGTKVHIVHRGDLR